MSRAIYARVTTGFEVDLVEALRTQRLARASPTREYARAMWWSVALALLSVAPPPPAVAVRTRTAPTMDGSLADPVWQQARSFGDFVQQLPDEGAGATQRTEVRVLYDDHAVYFGVRCFDSDPAQVIARLTRRDREIGSDALWLDLDTRGDAQSAFHFELSAAGVLRDAIRTGDGTDSLDFNWDTVWNGVSRVDEQGWTAELEIPLAVLRYPESAESPWRMQITRFVARDNEIDQWVFIPRDAHGEMLRYRPLERLRELPVPHGIEVMPFGVARSRVRTAPAGMVARRGTDSLASAGLDARFGLTPNLSLSATILPDFGQVDADQVILNLTTFETRFPEKRTFFLEGADNFTLYDAWGVPTGTQLFYSRRIGASSPSPYVPTGSTLIDSPDLVPIWGAAKLAGRIGDRVSIGIIDAVTGAQSASLLDAQGASVSEPVTPISHFFVGRARARMGELTLGVLGTSVLRLESPSSVGLSGLCPSGKSPSSNGRCTHDEHAAELDANWQSSDGVYTGAAHTFASLLEGGPALKFPDGTQVHSGDVGYGARIELAKLGGNWLFDVQYEGDSPQLDVNDAGFLRQQDLHRFYARGSYRTFGTGGILQNELGLQLPYRTTWTGAPLGRELQLTEDTTFGNFWKTSVLLGIGLPVVDNRETRDGALFELPTKYRMHLEAYTNPTMPLRLSMKPTVETRWRGLDFELDTLATLRAHPQLEISLEPTLQSLYGDPRWVDYGSVGGARAYLFGLQTAQSFGVTLQSTFTFTPRITIQAYAQLFSSLVRYEQLFQVSPGADGRTLPLAGLVPIAADPTPYGQRNTVLNVNVVFRWEYLPGSVLYVVYTRKHSGGQAQQLDANGQPVAPTPLDIASLGNSPVENVFLVKASYYFAR